MGTVVAGWQSMTPPLFGEPMRSNEPRYTEAFMEFWLISTMRGSKLAAFRAWQKVQPTSGLIPAMVDAMIEWQKSEQWQDETKQPHVATWLNRRGWEERLPKTHCYVMPEIVHHAEHRCNFCGVPHLWPCEDLECEMGKDIACAAYRTRVRI